MNRDPDAILQFRRAIQLDPNDADTRHNLAICLANHGKLDEAIAEWRTAAELKPENGVIHGWLAEALRVRGDRPGAIEHYRAAIVAGEHNPTWETNLAWLVATDPRSTPEQLDQALSIAKEASVSVGQKQPGALDALAAVLARTGQFDDAIKTAQAAISAANSQRNPPLASEIQARLNGYRAGRPFVIESPSATGKQ
jgi:tetratricopeptide (TPR) repeat protein